MERTPNNVYFNKAVVNKAGKDLHCTRAMVKICSDYSISDITSGVDLISYPVFCTLKPKLLIRKSLVPDLYLYFSNRHNSYKQDKIKDTEYARASNSCLKKVPLNM